jgi:hypothetical protein
MLELSAGTRVTACRTEQWQLLRVFPGPSMADQQAVFLFTQVCLGACCPALVSPVQSAWQQVLAVLP